jgi:hypothetical protein
MTQALNLANFANNLNTSGATTNAGLQNSSVTVTAGTGMSGGGAVALGSSVTLTNAGVTSVTGAGNVSVSASTGSVTITGTGGSGTVTSVATGNGLTGGTITTSGTISLDYYNGTTSNNTSYPVGSYVWVGLGVQGGAAKAMNANLTTLYGYTASPLNCGITETNAGGGGAAAISGTWKTRGCDGGSSQLLAQRTA